MPETFFAVVLSTTLGASSRGSLSYSVPNNEEIRFKEIRHVSQGIFNIVGLRNSDGYQYSNVSETNPITNTLLQDSENAFLSWKDFVPDLAIKGSLSLIIDLLDTSAASNIVRLLLTGVRITP